MLARLAVASTNFRHLIVSLGSEGELGPSLRVSGISVRTLDMRPGGLPSLGRFLRLVRIIREARPAAVQTWLYHADLMGIIAARLANFRPVVWNLRCSNMDLSRYRWSTLAVVKILIWLSSWPDAVMVNSVAGRQWHDNLGYRPRRWELVPNGVDTAIFRPDSAARARWRQRLGVKDDDILIGMVARRDPMKDHEGMLRAAAKAARRQPNLAFVLAGRGISRDDPALARFADMVGAPVHLIGECDDPARLNAAFDIAVLSSAFGEGFPNVVAEAMAAGVPCIVTDVGDAALIAGDTGCVVPPGSPDALAHAILRLAHDAPLRTRLGAVARRRVVENFGLEAAVARYEAVWASLIASAATGRSSVPIDESTDQN